MRPRTIGIGTILRRHPDRPPILNGLHKRLHSGHPLLLQAHNIDILPGILPGEQQRPVIQQVIQFTTVDLVEGDPDAVAQRELFEDVVGGEQVEAGDVVGGVAEHCVGLAAACLPVSETGDLRAGECAVNQRFHGMLVQLGYEERVLARC